MKSFNLSREQQQELLRYQKGVGAIKEFSNKVSEIIFKVPILFGITIYGIYVVLIRNDFIYHLHTIWDKHPQEYDQHMLVYYLIELSYHFHRAMYQFFDYVRKDFWAMFIHHWSTLALMVMSFAQGDLQIGVVVLVIHDNADLLLPLGKFCGLQQWNKLKDILFVLFASSWVICRLFLFSYLCIYTTYFYGWHYVGLYWPTKFQFGLLCTLEMLHIYWFTFLVRLFAMMIRKGKATIDDTRSFSESEDDNNKIIHDD